MENLDLWNLLCNIFEETDYELSSQDHAVLDAASLSYEELQQIMKYMPTGTDVLEMWKS